ncbi:extracellular serine/threonine protein kinase four-jointed-like [Watersipora subatra]|uniref:extracellular serine/threonine protein kinase four-jointed-like n=1 Tax=Watersipora subatra TaxID=2589382 RepID=UPI00355AF391
MPSFYRRTLLATITALFAVAACQQTREGHGPITAESDVFITANHSFSLDSDQKWREKLSMLKAVKIERGCGRMQNRIVTFDDGSKACARYRANSHLMQGEIYSHVIGRLLRIGNLPPLATTLPDIRNDQWSRVEGSILEVNWQSNKLLILTKYITDTKEVVLPQKLKSMQPGSVSPEDITPQNAENLAQWSDMIIFDYIVGNMDRVVNSLHNQQWNSNILDMSVHNLAQKDGSLIFFDNEDGLFHGYRILDRYSHHHEQSLNAICVFRQSTIDSITALLQSNNIIDIINEEVMKIDSRILKYLPRISTKTTKVLLERLANVLQHVRKCSHL